MKSETDKKNILMLTADLHHSAILFKNILERLPGANLSIIRPEDFHLDQMNNADLLVVVRNLFGKFATIIGHFRRQGIPIAYAVDDNLVEIGKAMVGYEDYGNPSTIRALSEFNWILCSNDKLLQYYKGVVAHPTHVLLVPATMPGLEIRQSSNANREFITLAYFGSLGPHQEALRWLSPILQEIEILRNTRIISAGIDLNPMGVPSTWIPFRPNYREALAAIDNHHPEILICPYSQEHRSKTNLEFKNAVKLFDALRLGAVLVASRLGPYRHLGKDQGVVTVENDLNEWKNALLSLIDEEESRLTLYHNAIKHVTLYHEAEHVANETRADLLKMLNDL